MAMPVLCSRGVNGRRGSDAGGDTTAEKPLGGTSVVLWWDTDMIGMTREIDLEIYRTFMVQIAYMCNGILVLD